MPRASSHDRYRKPPPGANGDRIALRAYGQTLRDAPPCRPENCCSGDPACQARGAAMTGESSDGNERGTPMPRRRTARQSHRMPPDQGKRQGAIAALAYVELGGREAALQFLNTFDRVINARPLDLASASEEGFATVVALLAARS